MPRWRVVLEFDHPGDVPAVPEDEEGRGCERINAPNKWAWDRILPGDATRVQLTEVYVRESWLRVT